MRAREALQLAGLFVSVLWTSQLVAAVKDDPTFAATAVAHFPRNFKYFEESNVIVYRAVEEHNVYQSADGGATWARVVDVPEGKARGLFMHQFESSRAYILTQGTEHYRTSDRGKTWTVFKTVAEPTIWLNEIFLFHADDPDRIIFNGMVCQNLIFCSEQAMYTIDGFASTAKLLRENTEGCWWAKSSYLFTTGNPEHDKTRTLCIVRDNDLSGGSLRHERRLLMSDSFFAVSGGSGESRYDEIEPKLNNNVAEVRGIVSLAVVKKYLLVATSSMNTDEMALYISEDTETWHRAMFPSNHRVDEKSYTVLESTNYSIQIDVMTTRPSNPMGTIFTSNSNGTYFTENIQHTNRDRIGRVDFEKIAGIQGIFMVNKVTNWNDVGQSAKATKKIISEITFDDGRTFEQVTAAGERLHLHSVTEVNNLGRVFSSPAPGLVMGNGNTGEQLKDYWKEANLYVSDDAGMTWKKALDGPHKYEFGDQGSILLAIRDMQTPDVDKISYSLNHGLDWKTIALPNGIKIRPWYLTTVSDSSSLKFSLVGETGNPAQPFQIIALDFDGLHEASCEEKDMENWHARVDKAGRPTCLMGHKQVFHRRKKKALCFMKQEFNDRHMTTEDCDCTDADYECDYNFAKDDSGTNCAPSTPIQAPQGLCKDDNPDATFTGPSGWRKIPGNTCRGSRDKEKQKEWKCGEALKPTNPATGQIVISKKDWGNGWAALDKYYLERGASSSNKDETIIVWPSKGLGGSPGEIAITQDHGKTWSSPKALLGEHIWAIIPHQYFKDMVFFVTISGKVWYTVNRGAHFHSFQAPYKPSVEDEGTPLQFHPDNKDWLLWMGTKCDGDDRGSCYKAVSYSSDRGDAWETAARFAERCEFTGSSAYKHPNRKIEQIICLKKEREDNEANNPLQMVMTNDWFRTRHVVEKKVKDYATMAEFIVAATENTEKNTLEALASLDGKNFAEAQFPHNFEVPHQHGYTVLDSSTHAVNMFVVTETASDRQMGTILKSNSNGTSYVRSVANVNCNQEYYVDFEKIIGLEGVGMVNVVANADETSAPKKLQSMITHNDGAEWAYLPPPAKDMDGKLFGCQSKTGGDASCALHIHGYTERRDRRKTYSSQGAVGYMFGWGNVGSELAPKSQSDTFMTKDAGITWEHVARGQYTWSLSDQGSIIVLVKSVDSGELTDEFKYSIDGGRSWQTPWRFSDKPVEVHDITTLRSGGTRDFLLWIKGESGWATINVDFSGFSDRVCVHDASNSDQSDYEIWSPKHPKQHGDCLFGHVSQFLRKKADRKCYNDYKLPSLYGAQNCSCTRQDFECDYNYQLDEHGACGLVPGLQPLSLEQYCADHADKFEWYPPTGYRRVPLTTCDGGQEMDKVYQPLPCPGRKDEFDRAHSGLSGSAVFMFVMVSLAVAAAVGAYMWTNWNKFGQIRLGEQSLGDGGVFDPDRPWVRYPIMAASGLVAVAGAISLVAGSLWRSVKGATERWGWLDGGRGAFNRLSNGQNGGLDGAPRRFTTRDSFARGRSDIPIVDEDEGELLGEESDEEI